MKLSNTTIACLCLSGILAACGQASPDPDASGAQHTIRFNRLENGNYEYCDENGVCEELPSNGGDCAILEIRVDLTTGSTCQTCILADGTAIDQGCSNTAVVCTLVTVPEPDCVVCAYVNGAIVYSSCTPDDPDPQPDCTSDADCRDGRCEAGVCVNEPQPGCTSDAECQDGEYCQFDVCPMAPCWQEDFNGDGEFGEDEWYCPPCYGRCAPHQPLGCESMLCGPGYTCVERDVQCFAEPCYPVAECVPVADCQSDADCRDGGVCIIDGCTEMACNDLEPDCNTCFGHCEWPDPDPCAGVDCGAGYHCERQEVWCFSEPCYPQATCVPDYGCTTDAECGEGGTCVYDVCSDRPCSSDDPNCATCFGHCEYTSPCAAMLCGPGTVCQEYDVVCITEPCPPHAECVPVQGYDCSGNAFCDSLPPQCPEGQVSPVVNGCWGECVLVEHCAETQPSSCLVSGCSGEICADDFMFSACIWREEYACYGGATCERDANGACGWRQTEELAACIERAGSSNP